MQFEILPDAIAAAAACAERIAGWLHDATDERGQASVAFSGGATPARMLEELGKADVDWTRVHVFQVDERAVREGHRDRNLRLLREHLLAAVDVPGANLHPMPVGVAHLGEGAERYQRTLENACGRPAHLDVVHLGLGSDGHTASLVPHDPAADEVDLDVAPVGEYGGHRRITLTFPALRRARHQAWLVVGGDKAGALVDLHAGRAIASRGSNAAGVVFCDDGAAARLSPG